MLRRDFLQRLAAGAILPFGESLASRLVLSSVGAAPLPVAEFLGSLTFQGEGDHPLGTLVGSGLGGRRALDLSRVNDSRLITPADEFFVRTSHPDPLPSRDAWTIEVGGLVSSPLDLSLEADILPHVAPVGVHLIECAGNSREGHFGLMSAAEWSGVSVSSALERLNPLPRAKALLVSGLEPHSTPDPGSSPGARWIFTFDQLSHSRAFFATEMNGASLSKQHGFPLRLVVPGWYGCCSIKWVNRIEFVDDTSLATDHMKEFAGRTYQAAHGPLDYLVARPGASFGPRLAKDYTPATIDTAAAPVRVEKWRSESGVFYRVSGLLWGGQRPTDRLVIRFDPGGDYEPVQDCSQESTTSWTLWNHVWRPERPGRYRIQLRIDDPSVASRRLDVGYYEREVEIDEL